MFKQKLKVIYLLIKADLLPRLVQPTGMGLLPKKLRIWYIGIGTCLGNHLLAIKSQVKFYTGTN